MITHFPPCRSEINGSDPTDRFVFLDLDGTVKVPREIEGGWSNHSVWHPQRLQLLRSLVTTVGAKVVITSDLRENGYEWIVKNLHPYITKDMLAWEWATPKLSGMVDRHEEVWEWMSDHSIRFQHLRFAIIEDTRSHFEHAPRWMKDRVVWCNNRHGFVPSLFQQAVGMFVNPVGP